MLLNYLREISAFWSEIWTADFSSTCKLLVRNTFRVTHCDYGSAVALHSYSLPTSGLLPDT